jgi:hypothetical protein
MKPEESVILGRKESHENLLLGGSVVCNKLRKVLHMGESITERVIFEQCHDMFANRAVELGWNSLEADVQFIAHNYEESK